MSTTVPIWMARYPPLQDLPVHLATLRVIHSLHDPIYAFDSHFALTLFRTQYVGYYLLGDALAFVVGVEIAHRLLMCAYLAGTVLALRFLVRALGRDERLCVFVVPLLYNPLFTLGLFPFLVGTPLLLLTLGLMVQHANRLQVRTGVVAATLALVLFYWHVAPFAILCLGTLGFIPWRRPRLWVRATAPLAPALAAAVFWMTSTDAGRQVVDTFSVPSHRATPTPATLLREISTWLVDSFRDRSDEVLTAIFLVMVAVTAILSAWRKRGDTPRGPFGYALVPAACIAFFLFMDRAYGFIWPIAQRFPFLCAVTALPLLDLPEKRAARILTGGMVALGVLNLGNVLFQFRRFERSEVGAFDEALTQMEPRKRVAALIYDPASSVTYWVPFMHFGSYYQARKGGVVQFTFAGYNHWPIDFLPGRYPPPGGPARPRWEWTPEKASVDREIFPFYDYVLTRGDGFHPSEGTYTRVWHRHPWGVWQRSDP